MGLLVPQSWRTLAVLWNIAVGHWNAGIVTGRRDHRICDDVRYNFKYFKDKYLRKISMLELLEEDTATAAPQGSKPVFRQRKTLGKKRQRDDEKNGSEGSSGKEPPKVMAKDAVGRKQRKLGTQEATTVQKQVAIDHESGKNSQLENVSEPEDEADKTEKNIPKLKSSAKAPPVSIRTVTITDFQPDVCKDFLQTGYCGYGDTCKFLHIRDELRAKAPILKDWKLDEKSEPEAIPFKCVLCKNDYNRPVKTDCGHIFCQSCFMDRYKHKKPNCYICGRDTGGVCVPVPRKELEKLLAPR